MLGKIFTLGVVQVLQVPLEDPCGSVGINDDLQSAALILGNGNAGNTVPLNVFFPFQFLTFGELHIDHWTLHVVDDERCQPQGNQHRTCAHHSPTG